MDRIPPGKGNGVFRTVNAYACSAIAFCQDIRRLGDGIPGTEHMKPYAIGYFTVFSGNIGGTRRIPG